MPKTSQLLARLAIGALVGVLLACTTTVAGSDTPNRPARLDAPYRVSRAPTQAVPYGVAMTSTPTYLAGAGHAAFPGITPQGVGFRLVWRQGTDHYQARDGQILAATLDSYGQNPTPPETVLGGGTDYRDPSISRIDGHEYLSYFTGSASNGAQGAFVSVDGMPAVRVDGGMPYAAVSAPVVHLPDGRLGVPFYGRLAGESKDTAWMAWSADGGATWTKNRILNPSAEATPEPWVVVDGDKVLYFARWGSSSLAVCTSYDSMQTCGGLGIIRNQATGRPTVYRHSSGLLVLVYRSLPSKSAQLAFSPDRGVSWYDTGTIMAAPVGSALGMTYAAMAEVPSGPAPMPPLILCVVGMEQADGSSALYSTYLAVSLK